MTKSFYDQKSKYEYDLINSEDVEKLKKVKDWGLFSGFSAMVWKGATDKNTAAFAMKDGCAIARFCHGKEDADTNTVNQIVEPKATDPKYSLVKDGTTEKGYFYADFIATPVIVNGAAHYKTNVLKECVDAKGVDTCFNGGMLTTQNKYRRLRKDTKALTEDKAGNEFLGKAVKEINALDAGLKDTDAKILKLVQDKKVGTAKAGCDASVLKV